MSTAYAPPVDRTTQHFSLITADDLHLFNEGTHYDLWKKLGSHVVQQWRDALAFISPFGRRTRNRYL